MGPTKSLKNKNYHNTQYIHMHIHTESHIDTDTHRNTHIHRHTDTQRYTPIWRLEIESMASLMQDKHFIS